MKVDFHLNLFSVDLLRGIEGTYPIPD